MSNRATQPDSAPRPSGFFCGQRHEAARKLELDKTATCTRDATELGRVSATAKTEETAVGAFATVLALIAAMLVGFLQAPRWLLVPLTVSVVYGMHSYHPREYRTWRSYAWSFIVAFIMLACVDWLARIASLYMTGHKFVQ